MFHHSKDSFFDDKLGNDSNWNDAFGSVEVALHWTATFYEHTNKRGISTQLAGRNPSLNDARYFDRRIYGDQYSSFTTDLGWFDNLLSGCFQLFQYENFQGITRKFCRFEDGEGADQRQLDLSTQVYPWPVPHKLGYKWNGMFKSIVAGPRCQVRAFGTPYNSSEFKNYGSLNTNSTWFYRKLFVPIDDLYRKPSGKLDHIEFHGLCDGRIWA